MVFRAGNIPWNKGIDNPFKGELSPKWKGTEIKHSQYHMWLQEHYGKASCCENKNCKKISNTFDWALKTEKEYSRNREDYFQLCRSCHRLYDLNKITILV